MAIEKTYNMIKPDGVRNGHIGEIISRIERVGLTIERMELGMVTLEEAEANYGEHKGKPFYVRTDEALAGFAAWYPDVEGQK